VYSNDNDADDVIDVLDDGRPNTLRVCQRVDVAQRNVPVDGKHTEVPGHLPAQPVAMAAGRVVIRDGCAAECDGLASLADNHRGVLVGYSLVKLVTRLVSSLPPTGIA